ncbi:MAG: hypothetical protein IPJ93_13710 [Bacteroidota bacterium]|nr:MAG: hypothetical protein IPJ93_13710 [Bacteroidota bacterium]
MKKRLSKIARDFKSHISDVADFLRINGYDCDENPDEEFSSEVVEFIENNFPAFLSDRNKESQKQIPKKKEKSNELSLGEQIPLELKIIESASNEKKLIERIIGFTEFDWNYTIAKFKGTCSQPVDFNLFDEVLCDLLLTEQMSAEKIGNILGFDIQKDPAENDILLKAIKDLKADKMLDGDESILWLTDVGIEYAKNGVKFSTFTRDFDLYIDSIGVAKEKVKEIFSNLKSEKQLTFNKDFLPKNIEEVKPLAELQAPEIHFPKKNFLLQECNPTGVEGFKAKVWVVLLENFRDNTMRAIVYDEKQNKVIDALSEALDKKDEIKSELLERLVKVDDEIEFTSEEKQKEQIEIEQALIHKQEEIEDAINNQDTTKIKEIEKEVEAIKRHFNSLEFEVELKKLFDTTSDTILIQSPWVRDFAFKNRVPFIKDYLRKGGRVYIAYSENESFGGEPMVQEESKKLLAELEKNLNFYCCELPAFHYKNVWLIRKDKKNSYYSGSYNILSFFVHQNMKNVRQEKMTRMDWDSELEEQYLEVFKRFGLKYINSAIDDFNTLCQNPPAKIDRDYLQKLRKVENTKLAPFKSIGVEEFDNALGLLDKTKTENLNHYRKIFFESEIERYKKQVIELSQKPLSPDKKKSLQNEFNKLREEFLDFLDIQMSKGTEVTDMINNLKVFNPQNHQKPNNNNKNKRRR